MDNERRWLHNVRNIPIIPIHNTTDKYTTHEQHILSVDIGAATTIGTVFRTANNIIYGGHNRTSVIQRTQMLIIRLHTILHTCSTHLDVPHIQQTYAVNQATTTKQYVDTAIDLRTTVRHVLHIIHVISRLYTNDSDIIGMEDTLCTYAILCDIMLVPYTMV